VAGRGVPLQVLLGARTAAGRFLAAVQAAPGLPYFPAVTNALTYSRVRRAMLEIVISFGHTASHSPSFEQLPNPSASAWLIIATTRVSRSTSPCGSSTRCEILALVTRCAAACLQAATPAPQPMHAAESIAPSTTARAPGV